ncbi:MAG: ATP-binding protein [Vampirovibrionales bacterium]
MTSLNPLALNTNTPLPRGAAATVLVVDDDPLVTTSLAAFLELETPYNVHTFNSPTQALEALDKLSPDLVMSDFLMPDLNGIEFLTQVREHLPDASLILLTGYADKESAIGAINRVGLYRYLEKPWNNQELLLTLQNGLERARLMSDLRATIDELQQAQEALTRYNQHLESIVSERTAAIQQTLAHLQAIVQTSGDGIVTIDALGNILSANPSARHWLPQGLEPCGRLLNELLEWRQPMPALPLPENTMMEGEWGAAGQRRPVEVSISTIPLSEKSPHPDITEAEGQLGQLLMIRDVSRRKTIERLREDFVATLTHDLRVPILAAIQTLGLMHKNVLGPLNNKQHDVVSMLVTNHEDLLALVNTLLDIYRTEAGQAPLHPEPLDGTQISQQVINELTHLANQKEQTLQYQGPQALPFTADRMALKRVLTNLIGNAIQHTHAQGTITVQVGVQQPSPEQPPCEGVFFAVSDTGRGIPADDLPHLFDRFSQGTRAVRSSGSGLGLYLSHQLVSAHGGTLHVKSRHEADYPEQHGTTFTVWLPLSPRL